MKAKDVRDLTAGSIDAALAYLAGKTPNAVATYNNGVIDVPSSNIPVISLTKANLDKLLDSGYYSRSDFKF